MARVIVILFLMIAVTAGMFALTRKSAVAPGEAATGPAATVKLTDMPRAEAPPVATPPVATPPAYDHDEPSLTTAEPRPVTNTVGTAAAPQSAQDVTAGPVAGAAPSIVTAGIDNKRNASFTGTATPGDTVSLIWGDKTMGKATADADGNWAVDFKLPKLKNDKELFASATAKDGSTIIGPKRATIEPAADDSALPRITLKSAEQAAVALPAPETPAAEPTTGIVVEKVASGDAGLTVLTGKADPGAQVSAAINGTTTAEVKVAEDGSWKLEAPNLSGKAADAIRVELRDAQGKKLDETELPYRVAATTATLTVNEKPAAKGDFPAVLTSDPGKSRKMKEDLSALFEKTVEPQKGKRNIIRVRKGDSLWRISRRHLGNGKKWASFYKLNKKKIDNPNLIFPGQTLIIPG